MKFSKEGKLIQAESDPKQFPRPQLQQIRERHRAIYFLLGEEAAERIETYRDRRELLRLIDRLI